MGQFIRQTRPLFVSSTFDDFHSERDLLASIIFPELAERLRHRRYELEPIDLRLGVDTLIHTDEAAKSRLILQVCLQEIARSRPFVLGLIGDRYGWKVPDELARRAAEESGFEGPTDGRSMTELELHFGILQERARGLVGSRVYVRELDLSGAPDDVRTRFVDSGQGVERLGELKDCFSEQLGPERFRTYPAVWDPRQRRVDGLADFRAMVTEDLWRDLDAATSGTRTVAVDWEARERDVLDEFFHHSSADFVGRTSLLRELQSFVTTRQTTPICAVTGVPGAGKSSLAAELARRLRAADEALVLDHAAGISGDAGSVDVMLRRWLLQLSGESRPASVDALTGADLEHAFARALTQAARQRPVAVIVDALNEFEQSTRARRMTWIPPIWPRAAKLIFTAGPGADVDSVIHRTGALRREIPPLGPHEAAELVDAIYRRYRRNVNQGIKQTILEKRTADGSPAHGSPLWLELVCQEMNLLDAQHFEGTARFPGRADERLTAMQRTVADEFPSTPPEMYLRMMRRAEKVAGMAISVSTGFGGQQGSEWLRSLMQMLALGRQGWRESDLRAILCSLTGVEWNDLLFSSVRRVFRGHLVQRGSAGQWDFSHSQFRAAAQRAYELPPSRRQDLHLRIAAHLTALHPDDVHRQRELMHHLVGADDRLGAAQLYARSQPSTGLARSATESLAARYHAGPDGGPWLSRLLEQEGLGFFERLQLGHMMLRALDDRLMSDGVGADERRLLLEQIRASAAAASESAATPERRRMAERQHAVALLRLADLAMDAGDHAAAKQLYEHVVDINHQAARATAALPVAQFDFAIALERLGTVALHEGQPDEAKQRFNECATILEQLIAEGPLSLDEVCTAYCTVLESLAELSLHEGDTTTAQTHFEQMAALEPHLDDREQLITHQIRVQANMARLAVSSDRLSEAHRLYSMAEDTARRAAEEAPESVESQKRWLDIQSHLGDVELARRRLAQATHWYGQALEGLQRLAASLPDDVPTQQQLAAALARYGDALMKGKAPEAAHAVFRRSFEIRSRISTLLPHDVRALRELGLAYERMASLPSIRPEDAVDCLQRSVEIYKQLKVTRPAGEVENRTLAIALFNLAREMMRIEGRELEGHRILSDAHGLLSDLRARGVTVHPDGKRVLSLLDTMFGGSGRWTHPVQPGDKAAYAEINVRGKLGEQALMRGNFDTAEEEYGKALQLARSIGHPPSIARAMGSLGHVAFTRRRPQQAMELLDAAAEYARSHNLAVEEDVTLSLLARLYAITGDIERGLRTTLERVDVARRADNVRGLGSALGTAAEYYMNALQFDRALPLLREAVDLFGQYRMDSELADAYLYLGQTLLELGHYEAAADALLQHIALSQTPDLAAQVNVGPMLAASGRLDEAIEQASRALTRIEAEGSGPVEAVRRFIAECVRQRDAPPPASP
ncbi:AAA family ATPase [Streptomyces cellulosae]|uniref:AAA family ATPase n=1 Tax=Streptomyces cellulosae TaxID=1968 RepID=A0ABW7YBT1_STRCE